MRSLLVIALVTIVCVRGVHAAETDKPGPMCAEHKVLEAVCTKCHPKLAAVFKAKGDWCETHGFPESFCPVCKPQAGGCPVAGVESDGAPADGLKVKLKSPGVAEIIGIQTVPVEPRPSRDGVDATVKLSYDATRVAVVNARAAGVVRQILAEVGTTVTEGAPLAVLESSTVGGDRFKLAAAQARLSATTAHRDRERTLERQGITARKDLLSAEQEWAAARAEVDALSASLKMAGDAAPGSTLTLRSPIAGVATRRSVTVGQLVEQGAQLFELVDTRTMWAVVEVPEAEIARVAVGQRVQIEIDSLPGRSYGGTLSYLAPEVDRETRTVTGRVALENPDGSLRANMFGHARILAAPGRSAIPVPREALQRAHDVALVFVKRAADTYETRRVKLGASDSATVEVLEGLSPGDQVVTTGSFLLKTETLKDSIGAGCCDD